MFTNKGKRNGILNFSPTIQNTAGLSRKIPAVRICPLWYIISTAGKRIIITGIGKRGTWQRQLNLSNSMTVIF